MFDIIRLVKMLSFCLRAFSNLKRTVCLPASWAWKCRVVNVPWATLGPWGVGANGPMPALCSDAGAFCALLRGPVAAAPLPTAAPRSQTLVLVCHCLPSLSLLTPLPSRMPVSSCSLRLCFQGNPEGDT